MACFLSPFGSGLEFLSIPINIKRCEAWMPNKARCDKEVACSRSRIIENIYGILRNSYLRTIKTKNIP